MSQPKHDVIEPTEYKPSSSDSSDARAPIIKVVIGLAGILVAVAFWFIFNAKTVQFEFSTPPDQIALSGGPNFKVGESFLVLAGDYLVEASATGYFPIAEQISVSSENTQKLSLQFTPLDGFLKIIATPPDVTITTGGKTYSPEELIQLTAKEHELTISHPMYIDEAISIYIDGKNQTQEAVVSLDRDWANTTIDSEPPGAEVFLDGTSLDLETPAVIPILSGEHEILLQKNGYKAHRQRLLAIAGIDLTVPRISLTKADARLSINSRPADASVIVNGNYSGQTPVELELRSDERQTIKILKSGYAQYEKTLSLQSNQINRLNATLNRNMGQLSIEVQPQEAITTVNGKEIGTGDHQLNLPTQEQRIRVELEGYAGFTKNIVPKLGLKQSIKVRLLTNQEARMAAMKPTISTHLGQNLVLLKPFEFDMGASRREPGRRANETLRTAKMSRLFYLGTKEVTNKEFRQFAKGHDSGKFEEESLNEDDMPVARVSWKDAALFCNWLSAQDNLEPFYVVDLGKIIATNDNATGYRLPTEAEWAWAARTSDENQQKLNKFPWGQQLPPPDRTGNYADRSAAHLVGRIIFGYNDNYIVSAPVASYKANNRGLFDMGGNVAEWTNDFYEIPSNEKVQDPTGPDKGDFHVIKGSSWMHGTVTDLRYSFRDYGVEGRQDVGFRIAKYAEEKL